MHILCLCFYKSKIKLVFVEFSLKKLSKKPVNTSIGLNVDRAHIRASEIRTFRASYASLRNDVTVCRMFTRIGTRTVRYVTCASTCARKSPFEPWSLLIPAETIDFAQSPTGQWIQIQELLRTTPPMHAKHPMLQFPVLIRERQLWISLSTLEGHRTLRVITRIEVRFVFLQATPIVCLYCFHLLSLRSFVCSARSEGCYLRWCSVHDSGGLYLPPIYERAVPSFHCV